MTAPQLHNCPHPGEAPGEARELRVRAHPSTGGAVSCLEDGRQSLIPWTLTHRRLAFGSLPTLPPRCCCARPGPGGPPPSAPSWPEPPGQAHAGRVHVRPSWGTTPFNPGKEAGSEVRRGTHGCPPTQSPGWMGQTHKISSR